MPLGPNCSRRQKGQEAGAAGARAANIVTDGQLFFYLISLFFFQGGGDIPPTHRVITSRDYVIYVQCIASK